MTKRKLLIEVDCGDEYCGEFECQYYGLRECPKCRLFGKDLQWEKAASGCATGFVLRCEECKAASVSGAPFYPFYIEARERTMFSVDGEVWWEPGITPGQLISFYETAAKIVKTGRAGKWTVYEATPDGVHIDMTDKD